MAETSNYECAAEIADAIRRGREDLAGELAGELSAQLSVTLRRPMLAAAVAGEVARQMNLGGIGTLSPDRLRFAAARVWELVDAIGQADTMGRRAAPPAGQADPRYAEGGCNLVDPPADDLG